MHKTKFKKIIIYSLITILIIAIGYGIAFYFSFFQGNTYVKDGLVKSKVKPMNYSSTYSEKTSLNDCKVSKIDDVKITILGNNVPDNVPILLRGQRYYLPLDYITKTFGYNKVNNLTFENKSKKLTFSEKNVLINDKVYNLRGWLLDYNNEYYLSLSDIEYIFSLTAVFNFENNSIKFLKSNIDRADTSTKPLKNGRAALIRLEDFSAGGALYEDINQTKLKALGDYLYQNNIKFHVAWVPRYKNPSKNFDNDLLVNNTLNNVGFIDLIDYLINSGAEVGLHGYTHQAGDDPSLVGTELSSKYNNSEEATRKIVEDGLFTANRLNIPVYFFESPHYKATRKQKDVIQQYFKYLFEPYSIFYYTAFKETSNGNVYIPCPLGYVKNRDTSYMIKRIKDPSTDLLSALFYHPTLELEYISLNESDNTFNWVFSKDSLIKSIVNALNENGYSTIHVTDIK